LIRFQTTELQLCCGCLFLLSCTSVIFACHSGKRSPRNTAVGQHVSNDPICIANRRMLFKRCYKLMRFNQHSSTCTVTRREVAQTVHRPQEGAPWLEPIQITLRLLLSSSIVIRYISVHSSTHSLRTNIGSANLYYRQTICSGCLCHRWLEGNAACNRVACGSWPVAAVILVDCFPCHSPVSLIEPNPHITSASTWIQFLQS
jgi:hypothetical protein